MIRFRTLQHLFVRSVPRELEPGVLYVSIEYATVVHACCCGCGEQVVTPLTPTDWRMTYDGESVSLHPSVGNWNQKCRSHYNILQNRVIEASSWSNAQIETERSRDQRAKAAYYGGSSSVQDAESPSSATLGPTRAKPKGDGEARKGLWARLREWL
jgi:hypothetical protein